MNITGTQVRLIWQLTFILKYEFAGDFCQLYFISYHIFSLGFCWQIVLCVCVFLTSYQDRIDDDTMIYDRNVMDYFKSDFSMIIYQLTAFITNPQKVVGIWSKG